MGLIEMTAHVIIVKTGKGCKVVPGHTLVDPGEDVVFHNHTGDVIDLYFPIAGFWATPSASAIANNATSTGTVAAVPPCNYVPYAVFCRVDLEFAEGHSHPALIVR